MLSRQKHVNFWTLSHSAQVESFRHCGQSRSMLSLCASKIPRWPCSSTSFLKYLPATSQRLEPGRHEAIVDLAAQRASRDQLGVFIQISLRIVLT